MKPNIELMKRLQRRFLRMRHPEHLNMQVVTARTECGTAMCIAGHTLDLAGYSMRIRPDASRGGPMWIGRSDYRFIAPSGYKVKNPLRAAAKELGLPYGDTSKVVKLFHDFSLATPRDAANRIGELIQEYQQ